MANFEVLIRVVKALMQEYGLSPIQISRAYNRLFTRRPVPFTIKYVDELGSVRDPDLRGEYNAEALLCLMPRLVFYVPGLPEYGDRRPYYVVRVNVERSYDSDRYVCSCNKPASCTHRYSVMMFELMYLMLTKVRTAGLQGRVRVLQTSRCRVRDVNGSCVILRHVGNRTDLASYADRVVVEADGIREVYPTRLEYRVEWEARHLGILTATQ